MPYVVTEDSTQHGFETPHGFDTPHRFPRALPTTFDIGNLVELLYPTGRAWAMPEGSNFRDLHDAFNASFVDLITAAYGSIDSTFPDNINFDESDINLWEYRYGIPYNSALTLAQRRNNIYQAVAFPQNIIARQHYLYIQQSLNDAGFNVKVYENIFFDGSGNLVQKTPGEVFGTPTSTMQFGGGSQFGGASQFGGGGYDVIANSDKQEEYSIGGILWPTFAISGNPANTKATIPKAREQEFRLLVLKLKPAHTVAYIFVNYT